MFEQNIRVMVWGLREKEKVRKKKTTVKCTEDNEQTRPKPGKKH